MAEVILVLKPGFVLYAGSVPVILHEPVQVAVDHGLVGELFNGNGHAARMAVADPTVSGRMTSARSIGNG